MSDYFVHESSYVDEDVEIDNQVDINQRAYDSLVHKGVSIHRYLVHCTRCAV